jgi:predicted nucleotidyltransferase
MTDVFAVAEVLLSHAVETHGEEIDIVAYYGSRARGDCRPDSDLDIFYIPAEGKDPPVGRTFLLQGLLFDFWAIPWNLLEGFATGRVRGWAFAPGLVHQAKVLYARSEEQSARFARVQQMVLDLQKPEARPEMIGRALEMFGRVLGHVGNLRLATAEGDIADVRYAGWLVIQSAWECLALANQVFFERGLLKGLAEQHKLAHRPPLLEQLIATISTAPEPDQVLRAAEELALGTRRILRELQGELPARATVQAQFEQSYPELEDMVGKLLAACAQGDPIVASAEAWKLQHELSMMLNEVTPGAGRPGFNLYHEFATAYGELGFPDLLALTSGSLNDLAQQAKLWDERLRRWLRDESVGLCEYESLEKLEASLRQ